MRAKQTSLSFPKTLSIGLLLMSGVTSALAGPLLNELHREALIREANETRTHVAQPASATQTTRNTAVPSPLAQDIPLRNLRVEVRQVGNRTSTNSDYRADADIILQPGNSGINIGFGASDNNRSKNRNLSQNALVLNGHKTRFHIGNTVPLRFYQAYANRGRIAVVPNTTFIEANSGFYAQPTWWGGQDVEVEIGTILSSQDPHSNDTHQAVHGNIQVGREEYTYRPNPHARYQHRSQPVWSDPALNAARVERSTTSTTLSIPLNAWTTIADSSDVQDDNNSGTLHRRSASSSQSLQVQMRITVQ